MARLRDRVQINFPAQGRTKQSFRDECDINNIMQRYSRTGVIQHQAKYSAVYADVSKLGDFRESIDTVRNANDLFMSLPSQLRARFSNDPALYLDFCSDPRNREEMASLGLLKLPVEPVVAPVEPSAPVVGRRPSRAGGVSQPPANNEADD